MGRQFLMTFLTATVLCGLAWGYRMFLNPMIVPPPLVTNKEIPTNPLPEQTGPREHRELAAKYFSDLDWSNETPDLHLAFKERCIVFTDSWEPDSNRKAVTIKPFAMILFNEDRTKRPVTVTCKSAYIEFSDPFDEYAKSSIRAVKGQLQGQVQVEGPDGLAMQGRTFVYSEEAMSVVCDDQNIQFSYAGSTGSSNGLEIALSTKEERESGNNLSDIEVESILLRKDVELAYHPEEKPDSKPQEAEPVFISSNGGLQYDLKSLTAHMRDHVQVKRGLDPEEMIGCVCDLLTLKLRKGLPDPVQADSGNNLELESLSAVGSKTIPLKLVSAKEELSVDTDRLDYLSAEQTAFLGKHQKVYISQRNNLFRCNQLEIVHNDDDEVVSMVCKGQGQYKQLNFKSGQADIIGNWQDRAIYTHHPETEQDQITLLGQASFHSVATSPSEVEQVRQLDPSRSMSASAEKIDFWLQREMIEENNEQKSTVHPVKLIATEKVVMQSNQTDAMVDKLLVHFQPVTMAPIPTTAEGNSDKSQSLAETSQEFSQLEDPLHVKANQMQIWVGQETDDAGKSNYVLKQAEVAGKVFIEQENAKTGSKVHINGDYIQIHNQPHLDQQEVAVFGQPAVMQGEQFSLQGNNFKVDRSKNLAWVEGAGRLSFPMKKGGLFKQEDVLTVSWTEKMSFQNNRATFLGIVSAKTQEMTNRLDCKEMTVDFTEAISFDSSSTSKEPDVKSIRCEGHVRIYGEEYDPKEFNEEGKEIGSPELKEIRIARFYSLMIEPESERTHAQGPGVIEIWSRNDDNDNKAGFGPRVRAVANRSLESPKKKWHYLNVQFQRESIGNISKQTNTFTGGVGIIYGPVKNTQERIDRDHLNENSGWLHSRELVIVGHKDPQTKKSSIEIMAQGDARIESLKFHATADKITYDQSKNEYLMRSLGDHSVTLYQQDEVGGNLSPGEAQSIWYNPQTRKFRMAQGKGLQGVQ